METVRISTKDEIEIVADYYEGSSSHPHGLLLVHMMPSDRTSWHEVAPLLQEQGYHVLAIDLRGHGESTEGPDGYLTFNDIDHQKSILDLEAGASFLKDKGIGLEHLAPIGASIGANLSLQFLSLHPEVKTAILLSAGLNYRNIMADPLVKVLQPNQSLLLVTSEDDAHGNNAEMNRIIFSEIPSHIKKKLLVYKSAGHGTHMFGKESPDLFGEVVQWLQKMW